jgi:predicted nuclease of predicted toxin-antitoxin system
MKFKIDENLPAEITEDLCALGHDAKTVFDQDMSGTDDERLLKRVAEESRVFLTMDKGIANITVYQPKRFSGLVLFRPNQAGRGVVLAFIRKILPSVLELDLNGRLVVVSEAGIRIR